MTALTARFQPLAITFLVVSLISPRMACCGSARIGAGWHEPEFGDISEADFDKYGGWTRLQCSGGARDRFYTDKIGNRWWLCTPEGNVFWSMGVYAVSPDNSTDSAGLNHYTLVRERYASGVTGDGMLNWSDQTAKRLKSWGFNTLDMYAYAWILPWMVRKEWPLDADTNTKTIPTKLPALTSNIKPSHYSMINANNHVDQPVKNLMSGIKTSTYAGWRAPLADYYDDRFRAWTSADLARGDWAPAVNSSWVLAVVADDRDDLWWAAAGTDFPTVPAGKSGTHGGWAALVTAPVQTAAAYKGKNYMYPDATVYTKRALQAYLASKYSGIEALNAAWGANYSTFGSTGTTVTGEDAGAGDGVTTEFVCALAQAPASPFSIQVLVDGTPRAGDNGHGAFLNLSNNGAGAGSIDYATGAARIVLDTAPPPGASVTVNYVSCGFGCGTGLLDEDGGHGWVPRAEDGNRLTGGTPEMMADLDHFLFQYASQYFATMKAELATYYPGHLYAGPTSLGSWSAPARKPVLQAASQYLDMLRIDQLDPMQTGADWADRMNFIAKWGGDKPWTIWAGATANPDSALANDPRNCTSTRFQTQQERGQWYQSLIRSFASPAADGIHHFVGVNFWSLLDHRAECANWGLMTRRDNPYDGVSAVMATGTDAWGYPTGGEAADYGDFISAVKAINRIWIPREASGANAGISGVKVSNARIR